MNEINNYRSNEERFFSYWLDELKEKDIVKNWWYESTTFDLHGNTEILLPLTNERIILDRAKTYTCDFTIEWNPDVEDKIYFTPNSKLSKKECKKLFFSNFSPNNHISYIDIKGEYHRADAMKAFSYKVSWVLQKHNTLVHKLIPLGEGNLFDNTFTPKLVSDDSYLIYKKGKNKGKTKIKWRVKTVNEYISNINSNTDNNTSDISGCISKRRKERTKRGDKSISKGKSSSNTRSRKSSK